MPCFLSYGIEIGGLRREVSVTDEENLECLFMQFEHVVSDFMMGGVKISWKRSMLEMNHSYIVKTNN